MNKTVSEDYMELFPYDTPRDPQIDGMKTIGDATRNSGVVLMEGACGTGKTLTALVPYLAASRNPDSDVDQVLIVTSVKQQMDAFQDEVERINAQIPEDQDPVTALTLVGLPDLHPYVEQELITEDIYQNIDGLREGARMLVADYGYSYTELHENALSSTSDYKYGNSIPSINNIEYDPYYAKYRDATDDAEDEDEILNAIPFNTQHAGLLSAEDIRDICARNGVCPHSMMRLSLEYIDLVIGNYNHIFDPKTVERVSSPLINDNTVTVFDEAHNLVPRVRNFLSYEASTASIQKSVNELDELVLFSELADLDQKTIRQICNAAASETSIPQNIQEHSRLVDRVDNITGAVGNIAETPDDIVKGVSKFESGMKTVDVSKTDIVDFKDFLDNIVRFIHKRIQEQDSLYEGLDIPLRDPEDPGIDKLTRWALVSADCSKETGKKGNLIGNLAAFIRDEVTDDNVKPQTNARSVGELIAHWFKKDNTSYYRSIEIDERFSFVGSEDYRWQEDNIARLKLHNCIPKSEISEVLGYFKSCVLMSATLEPLDVYKHTTGVSELDCPVYTNTYGLEFPEDNRLTLGVTANKFKHSNRGSAFTNRGANTNNETRKQYQNTVFNIVESTPGNVLVAMPSYNEAEWIGSLLQQSYLCDSDDVYIDDKSDNLDAEQTSDMKEEFFESDSGVLVTGARGTLVEGVDYVGDRLNAVVVCGVPITDVRSNYKQAIQAAYGEVFSNQEPNGFTLAFTIPAVRKARQAIGRVIRSDTDIGVRAFVDSRYTNTSDWDSVHEFLGPDEKEEMALVDPDNVDIRAESFWNMHT